MQFWFDICCKSRFSPKAPAVINIEKIGLLSEQHGDEKLYLQAVCLFRKQWGIFFFHLITHLKNNFGKINLLNYFSLSPPPHRWPVIFSKWHGAQKFLHLLTCMGRGSKRLNSRIPSHIRIIKNDLEGFLPKQAGPEVHKSAIAITHRGKCLSGFYFVH